MAGIDYQQGRRISCIQIVFEIVMVSPYQLNPYPPKITSTAWIKCLQVQGFLWPSGPQYTYSEFCYNYGTAQ